VYKDSIKPWHEQQWNLARTKAEKLDILRATVRKGRYSGDPRLKNMFKNFEGDFAFDPDIPGLRKTILLTASVNKSVAFGSSRTVAYAGIINGDDRFELEALNKPLTTSIGKTDADLLMRHKTTGTPVRIEVKTWSKKTQRTNFKDAEAQFQKMAEDRRLTGRSQAFVNRRTNIPEIEALGKKYGIPVYGDVSTSKRAGKAGQLLLKHVLDDFDRVERAAFVSHASAGGFQSAFGIYQVWLTGSAARDEFRRLRDPARRGEASWARFGETASITTSGGLSTTKGLFDVSHNLRNFSRLRHLGSMSRFGVVGRVAGRLAPPVMLAAGVFVGWQYYSGQITDRQFQRTAIPLVTQVVGGAGGAWAGAGIGAGIGTGVAGPPGAPVGAFIGGGLGAFGVGSAAGYVASRTVVGYHEMKDKNMEAERIRFLYECYASR
jgi:hypothetical protein